MSTTSQDSFALDLVKDGVEMFIGMKATDVIKGQLAEYTDIDTTRIAVRVGTLLAGQIAAHTVKPFTDAAVDFAHTNIKKAWSLTKRNKKTAE